MDTVTQKFPKRPSLNRTAQNPKSRGPEERNLFHELREQIRRLSKVLYQNVDLTEHTIRSRQEKTVRQIGAKMSTETTRREDRLGLVRELRGGELVHVESWCSRDLDGGRRGEVEKVREVEAGAYGRVDGGTAAYRRGRREVGRVVQSPRLCG